MLKTFLHCAEGKGNDVLASGLSKHIMQGLYLGESAAAVLVSRMTGKQAALINLSSGLATAPGFSELHLVGAQVIFF